MFKKFKDKLAEEMKQSPSRLQAGMQQLAQAVISPAASNNYIQDITTSIDDMNITSEEADTLRNNSATSQFQSVDLQASNSMERSRRSSFSSVTSENFFPTYESPGNLYHMQSDMEQSASEFEDSSSSSQLEHITKEELYAGYQKLRTKYTKYRAVYRELYKENMKMKSVLVETQDKALRRIANLKEQCQLEQEAKAHLEEALRIDIEEKDHLIDTLTTKIKLLQVNGPTAEVLPSAEPEDGQSEKSNFELLSEPTNDAVSVVNENLVAENTALKEKVKKFEILLAKCNESLKKNKEKITQLTENRDILERDLNILSNSTTERTEMLESEIYKAKREILSLNEQIDVLKKREEDSALSLAENKLFIHRELEVKEEQNKQLQQDLKKISEYKDILAEAVVKYDHEFKQFETVINDRSLETEKKVSQLHDLFSNKSEAVKLIQQDVKHKFLGTEEETRSKHDREIKQRKEISAPAQGNSNEEISRSRDELEIKNAQLLGLTTELKSCKSTINDLKEMLKDVTMDWEQEKREKECLIANILAYKKIIGEIRRDCNSVKDEIRENYSGQEALIDSVKNKLATVLDAAGKEAKKEAADLSSESEHGEEKESQDSEDKLPSITEASSVELKTIINENNALRKKCEQLIEQNEHMISKVNEFDKINLTNVKLIAEIDELNFKLRDIAELQETQDKLQSEMEGLKGKSPFSNNVADNNERFRNEVTFLKDKLDNYDILSQDNTALRQELVELKNELATTLNNMEILKLEQSKSVENFSRKCGEYENMIMGLSSKFTEQTLQLEKLHEELTRQKTNFSELNDRYEARNSEFKNRNEAFAEQASELKELNDKYKTRCSEIESLREKETEILNQLDETVKVREEMISKFNELEACKNNIIDKKNNELEELNLRQEKMLQDSESMNSKTNEIEVLRTEIAGLIAEIEILGNNNAALNIELDKLKSSNLEVERNNKELKDECNNLSKLNAELEISQKNFHQENNALKDQISHSENELQILQERLNEERFNLEQRIKEINEELEKTRAELQAKLEEFEYVCQENLQSKKEIEDLDSKLEMLNDVEAKNAKLLKELEGLNGRIITLANFEDENRALKSEIENLEYKVVDLDAQTSENRELRSELKISNELKADYEKEVDNLRQENKNLALQIENLQISNTKLVHELESMNSNQSKSLEDKSKTITELERTSKNFENKIVEHLRELDALKTTNKELQDNLAILNTEYSQTLENKTGEITKLQKTAQEFRAETDALKIKNNELEDQLEKLNSNHSKTLDDKASKIADLEKLVKEIENKFIEQKQELEAEKIINKDLQDQLAKIKTDHSTALENKTRAITELEKGSKDFENELISLREEIKELEATNKDLREQLMSFSQSKNADEALLQNYNRLKDENKELCTRIDEALILQEAKESQIEIMSKELKHQTEMLTDKLKTNEEEQSMRIKQLVKEFQAQIHDKDEQIQAALEKRFERQQNYESELIQQYKEQLKDFQIELTAKSEQIESLILDNKETIQAYKDQIEELTQAVAEVKKEHSNEIQGIEQNWKSVLKQRTDQLETKHVDEVNELTKEWLNERKTPDNSDTSPGELESTSRVAMATIQSNTGSLHSLQQTLISQKRELSELRKLLRIRNESLEGSTEIEYLRNILFEYMMGRETLVLTRVISAVVKFDQEQTSKVLKKEEDKLTLLGSIGLL